jgi:hypothetical protein
MVLALAVLAYLVYITMTGSEKTGSEKFQSKDLKGRPIVLPKIGQEHFNQPIIHHQQEQMPQNVPQMQNLVNDEIRYEQENFEMPQPQGQQPVQPPAPAPAPVLPKMSDTIKYDNADISGMNEEVHGAAPFGSKGGVEDGKFATVKYSGLVDAKPGDVIQIEGTDLLTAPLVDNMLYTNSIANTNRNASQDLRGDIPLQFNDSYTPFYSSVIYGAPLSQKQMTIGNL